MKWVLIITSILLGSLGQILMKWGIDFPKPLLNNIDRKYLFLFSWPVLLGLCSYGISAITWLLALKRVELSLAYPLVSLGYVFVVIASYFLFNETITPMRMVGLGTIIVGVLILSQS